MTIKSIKTIANKLSSEIFSAAQTCTLVSKELSYDQKGKPNGDLSEVYAHSGIYLFTIEKESKFAVAYVGKSENDSRLRQHIANENKDGTRLSESVRTKHSNIKEALRKGFKVKVHLYSNADFDKASLSCIEITALELAKGKFKSIFPKEKQWIKRIG